MVQPTCPTCPLKKIKVDSKRKDMEYSTIFSKNIINLTWCTIFKMLVDDPEILGANNPTQPTTPNHPPKSNQPLVNQLEVLEPSLGLDLIDSQSSCIQ